MANSSNVIRTRRLQPVRGWLLLGFFILVASIPLSMLKPSSIDFSAVSKFFESKEQKKSPSLSQKAKISSPPAVLKSVGSDSAAYVEALDRAARKLVVEINKSPSDPALQNRLGLIYLTLGDSKSAEQCFLNAVNLSRSNIDGCAAEVEKLKRAGKMSDASAVVLEASKLSVELSAAHSNLARIYDQVGDRHAVIAQLDQITKDGLLLSGFSASGGKLKSKDVMLSNADSEKLAIAESLFKRNQLPAALAAYRELATANPKMAFIFDRIGLISVMTGDISGGMESWEKAAKLNPASAAIRSNLALAYHQLGRDREAEQSFRKALSLDPKMEESSLNLSELLSTKGNFNAAVAVLQESLKHCPHSARVANNLGTLLVLNGKYPDAINAFRQAIRNDPNMASAHYGLGVALLKTHKYLPAIREFKLSLALNPGMHEAQAKIEEAQRLSGFRG